MAWDITFRFDTTPEAMRTARKAIYAMAQGVGASDVDVHDIELAVGEALGNAHHHAYHDSAGVLDVTVSFHGTHLTIAVRDYAGKVRSLRALPETLPTPSEGRGLYVIRTVMDEVTLGRAADGPGVVLRMVKRVHWRPAVP